MPHRPGVMGKGAIVGAFQEERAPGVNAADVSREVASQAAKTSPERVYTGITRSIKITNRAEKGAMAGKPFVGVFGGQLWPEEADFDDKSTWLQPGESMLVPREVAVHLCGDCFSPQNLSIDGPDIVRRYGDYQFKQQNEDGTITGKNIQLIPIGPPKRFPDLLVEQVDSRGRAVGDPISIYEKYIDESKFRTSKKHVEDDE